MPAVKVKKENNTKATFLRKLDKDLSIDWEFKNLSKKSLVADTLYLLGVSIDEKKYSGYLGFKKFLEENNVDLNLTEKAHNERT